MLLTLMKLRDRLLESSSCAQGLKRGGKSYVCASRKPDESRQRKGTKSSKKALGGVMEYEIM